MRNIKYILLNQDKSFISKNNFTNENSKIITSDNLLELSNKDFNLAIINDNNEDRSILNKIIDKIDCVYIRNFKNISRCIYNVPVIAKNYKNLELPYLYIDDDSLDEVMSIVNELNSNVDLLPFPVLERIKSEEVSCRMVDVNDDEDSFKVKLH